MRPYSLTLALKSTFALFLMCAAPFSLFSTHETQEIHETHVKRINVGKKQTRTRKAQKRTENRKIKNQVVQKSLTSQINSRPTYCVKSVGASGKTLAMNDETIWEISSSFASIASQWSKNSMIVIRPNRAWFSSYNYRLHNIASGEAVEADLSQGPFAKYALFINRIDRYYNVIELSNGTTWSLDTSSSSQKVLNEWKERQAVLVGENNSWFGLPHILVNINENEYLPVQLLNIRN